jgi:hypothetical protein
VGYNDFNLHDVGRRQNLSTNWVGDLMLEGTVTAPQSAGEFLMEVSKGLDRFQARWDLATGQCTLSRIDETGKATQLKSAPTPPRFPQGRTPGRSPRVQGPESWGISNEQ